MVTCVTVGKEHGVVKEVSEGAKNGWLVGWMAVVSLCDFIQFASGRQVSRFHVSELIAE